MENGDGIVGVQIIEKNHIWGHHAIEFFAIGTARLVVTLGDYLPARSSSTSRSTRAPERSTSRVAVRRAIGRPRATSTRWDTASEAGGRPSSSR
jgi:hypothetical protein